MRVELIYQGFPGRMTTGYMHWSSVVLVEHAGLRLLFDTGGAIKRGHLPTRLAECGVVPHDIDIVVLSHFHEDHVHNCDLFTRARVLMHRVEAEFVESNPDYWPIAHYVYPSVRASGRLELIDDDIDIAPGVSTLLVPGHTPGSMALVLREPSQPTTVLAGDAVKNLAELASGTVAMSLDDASSAASIGKIRAIADVVVPGHDRMLRVEPDRIVATTGLHERITVPAGVAGAEPRHIDIVLEATSLPISHP